EFRHRIRHQTNPRLANLDFLRNTHKHVFSPNPGRMFRPVTWLFTVMALQLCPRTILGTILRKIPRTMTSAAMINMGDTIFQIVIHFSPLWTPWNPK
ncbi:MAG: hypothetical protein ACON37_03075, partial [Candidatus Puniceispirillaceae bacterium]